MSVQFEGEKDFNNLYSEVTRKQSSGLTDWLITKGFAKDESGAKSIMVVITIICFALTIYFIIK